jgi:hypothetical protein
VSALNHQTGGDHYHKRGIQPFEYSEANRLTWAEGEIIKYTTRHEDKGREEDLMKGLHIMQMILESRYGVQVPVQWDQIGSTHMQSLDIPEAPCDCGEYPMSECGGKDAVTDFHQKPDCPFRDQYSFTEIDMQGSH